MTAPEVSPTNDRVDFGTVKPSCSCLSSFDGEGDGACPIHRAEVPADEGTLGDPTARGNAEWVTRSTLSKYFDPATVEEILRDLRSVEAAELQKARAESEVAGYRQGYMDASSGNPWGGAS